MTRIASANYWPTQAQTLILRAALGAPAAALDAWRSLRPGLDLDRLDPSSQRLLPLLHRNLAGLGVDDPVFARCRGVYRYHWSRNQLLFHRGAAMLEALAAAGVPTLLLEGAALVVREYRDPGLRPMSDFDVAVPATSGADALAILERSGWSSRHQVTESFRRVRHAAPFEAAAGLHCDLHWWILEECADADADLWAASEPARLRGRPTRVLSRADQLFHVCVHGARQASEPGICWIADAMWLIGLGDLDWGRVVEQATRHRFTLRVRETLEFLAIEMDAPVPGGVRAELAAGGATRLERVERRLLGREHRLLGQLPIYWCHNLRARDGAGWLAAVTFPRYLQHAWGLQSLRQVPRGAVTRALRRLRARRA